MVQSDSPGSTTCTRASRAGRRSGTAWTTSCVSPAQHPGPRAGRGRVDPRRGIEGVRRGLRRPADTGSRRRTISLAALLWLSAPFRARGGGGPVVLRMAGAAPVGAGREFRRSGVGASAGSSPAWEPVSHCAAALGRPSSRQSMGRGRRDHRAARHRAARRPRCRPHRLARARPRKAKLYRHRDRRRARRPRDRRAPRAPRCPPACDRAPERWPVRQASPRAQEAGGESTAATRTALKGSAEAVGLVP